MSNIKGITVYRHFFMQGQETHYFGYDEENEFLGINSDLNGIMMGTTFNEEEKYIFEEFVDKLINQIMIFTWDNYYRDYAVDDGEEWKVTVHYKSGRTRSFSGMNAYPSNYEDFVNLCRSYDFAFDENNYDFEDIEESTRYDDFLEEIDELESTLLCPNCDSDYVVHTNPMGYDFMCGSCGHNFEYNQGRHKKDFEDDEKKNMN